MSTSSVVIESKDIHAPKHAENRRVILPARVRIKNNNFEAIKIRIHRHFIESVKSSVVVFACLGLYKISGVHAWWVQLVQKILFTP